MISALVVVAIAVALFLVLRDDPPPDPPVRNSGEVVMLQGTVIDLDELAQVDGQDDEGDVALSDDTAEANRLFGVMDGGAMSRVEPTDDPRATCLASRQERRLLLGIAKIDIGDVFCVRTNRGRLSVAEVKTSVSAQDSRPVLQVTTFE